MTDRTPPKARPARAPQGDRESVPGLPRWAMIAGIAVLVVLLAIDPLFHGHPKFGIDGAFAFYAWYGFAASLALVVIAKVIGVFLRRRESYYD